MLDTHGKIVDGSEGNGLGGFGVPLALLWILNATEGAEDADDEDNDDEEEAEEEGDEDTLDEDAVDVDEDDEEDEEDEDDESDSLSKSLALKRGADAETIESLRE